MPNRIVPIMSHWRRINGNSLAVQSRFGILRGFGTAHAVLAAREYVKHTMTSSDDAAADGTCNADYCIQLPATAETQL
jgi:hypothetical protein